MIFPIAQVPQNHKAPVFLGQSLSAIKQMEAAFTKMNDELITIYSDTGKTTIELSGKRIREEQPSLVWAFDGTNLYLRDKSKHLYVSGKCLRHRAVEVVSRVTHRRVNSFTRSLLLHQIPFEDGLLDSKVALLGTAAPHGILCDILEVDGPAGKTSIFLRRSDGLPQSVSTATYFKGKLIATENFSYSFQKLTNAQFVLSPLPSDKFGRFPQLEKETP